MKIRSVILAVLLLTGLSAYVNFAQSEGGDVSRLAGTYGTGHKYGASFITLDEDGTYWRGSSDCTQEFNQSGTYTLKSGKIYFTITKYTVNGHGETNKVDLLDPKKNAEVSAKSEEIERSFEMVPVYWGPRIYLMAEYESNRFAHAINPGIEPRKEISSEPWMGSHYLRKGDESKSVSGTLELSSEARLIVLKAPIMAMIVNIEGEKGSRIATINKGSVNGITSGVMLLERYEEPSPWWEPTIVSIGSRTAKVKVSDNAKVRDKISSRYVAPYLYSTNLNQ